MIDMRVPDQSALFYRKGYLSGIPEIPGGTAPEVVEIMYLNQYGDTIVSTLPTADLGHGILSEGHIRKVRYVDARCAAANFRAMVIRHRTTEEDGWLAADLEAFTPGDPSTLKPLPRHSPAPVGH